MEWIRGPYRCWTVLGDDITDPVGPVGTDIRDLTTAAVSEGFQRIKETA